MSAPSKRHPMPSEFSDLLEISRTIRAERRELGLTQEQLAGLSGVSLRFLIELERGKKTVAMDKLAQVASALGKRLILD
jgi:HTH-type transcriptional regulator / antitoxin HipB